jgi:hypothetical protein
MARLEGRIKPISAEKWREYTKKSRAKNIEHARRRDAEYQKKRNSDPSYRMISNVGRRLRDMIKGNTGSTRHLPYTANELADHIERQFTKGMTWENYGSFWHIDHIIPASSFDCSDPQSEDFKTCWSLSNLRPLPAFDNMSKGAKRQTLI